MTVGYVDEIIHVRNTGHLCDREIALAVRTTPDDVREWLAGHGSPSGLCAERLTELSALVERLSRVIRPTYISVWLNTPLSALDDDRPIERIAAGECGAAAAIVSGLEDPGAV